MDTYIVFWLAATVVFVLVELMTVGLTSIWFAAGSFVAFIIALLGGNVVVQGIAFILVSVVLLALTKPWAEVHQFQDSEDKRGQSGRRKNRAHRGC